MVDYERFSVLKVDQRAQKSDHLCFRAMFIKLWSADHTWSSGSAVVVVLD
jgi:hypothetical protein